MLNLCCSESTFLLNLCSCNDKEALWCFVHNIAKEKEIHCVDKTMNLGFC